MLDQKQSNSISKVIGCVFILFGFAMFCIGIPFIMIKKRDDFENTIMVLSLISGVLMLIGGYQNIKKAKQKDVLVKQYEEEVKELLKTSQNSPRQGLDVNNSINQSTEAKTSGEYKPDILAIWDYTKKEWKLMTREETTRRLKEGIWVALGVGLLGGWVLKMGKGTTFLTGFIISLVMGVFVSLLKVLISNNLFSITKNNRIIITTNALIINGKFKTIQDSDIHLEYVKSLKIGDDNFIEFSLQWQTRKGFTNDQFRIFVPDHYISDIQKIMDYYKNKGVKTQD